MARRKKNSVSVEIQLDPAEIGQRAHQKWIARGCIDGFAQQDWLEAEVELRAEKAAACVIPFEVKEETKKEKREQPQEDPKIQDIFNLGKYSINDLVGGNGSND